MDPKLFRAATEGSVELIEPFLERPDILAQVTPIQDTIIHIAAAKLGHLEFVKHVQSRVPAGLFTQANSKGDTPFHVAARAGHSEMIGVLVSCVTDQGRDVEFGADHEALRMTNLRGDTAMHDAVRNLRLKVVKLLIQLDPQLLRQDNNNTGESPLHAAVEKGELAIVEEIINGGAAQYSYKGPNGRTALHAAIIHKRRDIAKLLLEKHSQLAAEADDNNSSPMHFATRVRSFRLIELLLKYDTSAPSRLDKTGVAQIHIAALYGKINIIEKFRELCPNLETLPDKKHRNILHFAIEGKEISLVKYILSEKGDFEEALLNEKDEDGNTPLHQATLSCQPHVVSLLVNDKRIDRMALNKQGLSASAIAVSRWKGEHSLLQQSQCLDVKVLVLATLLHAAIPTKKWFKFIKSRKEIMRHVMRRKMSIERYKCKANNLMVIATLVATVTFAAGFTMPGGYNSNDEHQKGVAVLIDDPRFKAFVACDARALYSSTLAVIFLIGVQLMDSILPAALMFYFARLLTVLALLFQLQAFEYGVRITTLTGGKYALSTFGNCALIMIVIGLFIAFLHPLFPFLYCSKFYLRFRCWLNQTRVGTNQPRNSYKQCEEDVAALLSYKDAKNE